MKNYSLITIVLVMIVAMNACNSSGTWNYRFRDSEPLPIDYAYQVRVSSQNVFVAGPSVLRVFDRQKGTPKWDIGIPGGHYDIDREGNVYAVQGEELISLDKDGLQRWSFRLPIGGIARQIIISDNQAYALINDSLLRLNIKDGMPAEKPVVLPGLPPVHFTDLNFYRIERAAIADGYWLSWSNDSLWQHRISDGALVRDTFCGPRICDIAIIGSEIAVAIPYTSPFTCPINPLASRSTLSMPKGIIRMQIDPKDSSTWYSFKSSSAFRYQLPSDLEWDSPLPHELEATYFFAVKPAVTNTHVYFGSRKSTQIIELDKESGNTSQVIKLDGLLESTIAEYGGYLYYVADGTLNSIQLDQ